MFTLRLLGGASLDGPDGPVAGRAALRQRIALLALLAVDHPRPLSRDKLVAFLWPEGATGNARQLLRESLYILRSALGDDSVLSAGDDLRLNPERLTCDLWEFEAALARNDLEAAVAVYRGQFLSGFHLPQADEFERWVDGERARLARQYGQALEQLAEQQMRGGDPVRAVEWWSRLAGADSYNSRIALRYMQALEAAGDRAAALRYASTHSDLLRRELDAVPEPEVVALAERLKVESRAALAGPPGRIQPEGGFSVPLVGHGKERLPTSPVTGPERPTRHVPVVALLIGLAVVAGLGALGGTLSGDRSPALIPRRVAVPAFANHTGRADLEDIGSMTADWIIRGLMETPLIDVTDLQTVYAAELGDSGGRADPRTLARRNGASLVVTGNYYRSGDSLLFQAGILDVASGRVLRSFAPVGAPVEKPTQALDAMREQIANGLGALVNPASAVFPVDPDLVPPPSYPAYREFVAGLRRGTLKDWAAESRHYRRAAQLDSNFIAPLVQLAYRATWLDECHLTDSIATILEPRTERLTPWDRLTIGLLHARCQGDMETAVRLLGQRFEAYPHSLTAKRQYSAALQHSNQPRASQEIMRRLDPEVDPAGTLDTREATHVGYWWFMAASHHALGDYVAEIAITDRWRDSSSGEWLSIRARALGALGRDREALGLLRSMTRQSIKAIAAPGLTMATELAVHGHERAAIAVAESILVRLNAGSSVDLDRASNIAWANRLLGRRDHELDALEQIARHDPDTLRSLEARARIAVLMADTAEARRIDDLLAEQSNRPLRSPVVRGGQILARAHIAAGFGHREKAVALLQDATARGMLRLGSSYAFHADLLLAPLRGYPPFDALLNPEN